MQFVQRDRDGALGWIGHIFGRACEQNGIEHRLTKPDHPWTNSQAERMVRTIKEATAKSFHYMSINELRRHVRDWLAAYNFAKQLKALRFKTPYEAIEELWKSMTRYLQYTATPSHDGTKHLASTGRKIEGQVK